MKDVYASEEIKFGPKFRQFMQKFKNFEILESLMWFPVLKYHFFVFLSFNKKSYYL